MSTPVERLQEILRIPTVSYPDESRVDWPRFAELREALERLYPRLHETLEHEVLGGDALLYRWRGASEEGPLVLMAHMDVVPVVDDEWRHPPFDAVLTGAGESAVIHGRGAIDDKGSLAAVLEAVEGLVASGFRPASDVYLAFGHDEETSGSGARAIAAALRERGVTPSLVLDEGGAVVDGVIPGVTAPTAMVGVAERGIMTVTVTAREGGGHASTPPPVPATARLARAIDRLQRHPFPIRLAPPVRAMLATAAPYAPQPLRWLLGHLELTGPLVAAVFARLGPEGNASVRTTAVATVLRGAPGENVLATTAQAAVNIRTLTGDTVDGAVRRLRRVIADDQVEVEVVRASEPSPVSPWRGGAWRRVASAVATGLGEDIVTLPYLQLGASDSRWFTSLSAHVYRFTPFHLTREERDALHAHNERIRVEVWLRGIGFYRALLQAS